MDQNKSKHGHRSGKTPYYSILGDRRAGKGLGKDYLNSVNDGVLYNAEQLEWLRAVTEHKNAGHPRLDTSTPEGICEVLKLALSLGYRKVS